MTSEECPVPLRRAPSAGPEDYGSAQVDDIIEEVGPGSGDDVSIGSDLSALVLPFPELAPVVFFCLKQTTCPRNWCIRMVSSPWFERISIMVILLNCVTLGMYQPCENIDCTSDRCQILQAFDAFIYIFFALEMVVKMVALGIFGRRCYLGDTWNRLDFFIVMAGMVEYSLDLQNINLSAIRTVRVLRPLKAINRVPSMRILVNLLLDTLPMLGNVLLLCFFVFFIFGIIGVQLWAGLLRNRCYPEVNFTLSTGMTLPTPYYQPEEDDERPFICSLATENGIMSCTDVPARRENGHTCTLDKEDVLYRQALGLSPEPFSNGSGAGEAMGLCLNWNQYYTRCHTGNSNPHKGAINFDNIVYAWIVIFQVITLEGWVEIMYYVMDAHSFYNFIYFILLIIIGSFFMINLCLVVIATQFSETKQREHQLMQEQRAQCLSSSTLASMAEPGDCYEEIFQLVCHVLRKAKRRSAALYYTLRGKPPPPGGGRGNRRGNQNGERHHSRHPKAFHCPHQTKQDPESQPAGNSLSLAVPKSPEECPICALALKESTGEANAEDDDAEIVKEKEENHLEDQGDIVKKKKKKKSCFRRCMDAWNGVRKKLWGIVESKYFSRGIMIAILINTISMGIEHHNQPEELTNVLEICNIVFTSMFTLEMILKLTAFGFFEYLRNPYNIFDGIIVIISVCEIIGQADGGLSVLRTFRLLRVIKLVRFMPALRRQLVVLMKTMDNVATFCMLLMLFIFIFSILGMHIFGCKFSLKTEAGDTVPDRKNFDSLLWAIVTVFQILTQEDWNMVLYNGMASTSPCAALYFVALMTFGNYVLFNLLVAILVEGFQAEGDANRSYSDDDRSSCNFEENEKQIETHHLSDPKICTLTPNGHLDLSPLPAGLFPGDKLTFALGSRKNSVISLGRANLEQRTVYSGRSYHNWGRPLPPHPQALWARRSSWNSLVGVRPCSSSSPSRSPVLTPPCARRFYGYGLGGLSGVVGGSLRIRGPRASSSPHRHLYQVDPDEEESLLSPPPLVACHALHPPENTQSEQCAPRRDRRALSLELPHLLQVPGASHTPPLAHYPLPPIALHSHSRKSSFSGGLVITGGGKIDSFGAFKGVHQDCNGKTPLSQLLQPPPMQQTEQASGTNNQRQFRADVFPQVNARSKDREDLDDDIDYSLCFRVQKMLEAHKPDWCETREDWSIFLFSPQNKFRQMCQSIIAHKLFDYVVLVFIFSNCITVALERPKIHQGSLERIFLTISNYIFTAIFVGEMTLKVVSMGLYMGEQAYLRSSWNILDGFLVFVSLIDIVVSMAGGAKILGVLRVLRLLRTLRPLRVISRAPGLKLVVETLITSLKPIGNIVLICCAFFIIFGILGVQLFKGKFFYCFGLDIKNITNKSDCLQANYKWVHHKYNFDNLGQALMSLFVLASKDGWVNIMYHGLDAVGVDQQPVTNNNPWMLLYFISFLLIVSFFVLNMFVGVVVENFHKCRQHQEVEEAKRREEKRQRRMEKKRRKAQKLPYYASYSHVRLMIHTLCTNHYLDLIITFIICINVITMSLEHYNQPRSLDLALKYCNYFFTSTFVLESILKLIAFGFRRFFKDRWNQLDLAIVLLSVMGITLEEIEISAALPINPTIIRIMRVLRIARVLKLLKMATGMRALLDTVVQALPQVGNLGLLFMLLFFIYAALGVELFGELVCNADYPCEGMSRHATFENFGMAFLTLFQVSTGDNWNGIMKDTLRECPPDHGTDIDYACNPSLQFISPMYFVSFVLTAQFVLINVVVAVLMKHLDDSNKEAQEEAEMDAEIELELAQGTLCCMGAPGCGGAGTEKALANATQGGPPTAVARERGEGVRKMRLSTATTHSGIYTSQDSGRPLYSPAQRNTFVCTNAFLLTFNWCLHFPACSFSFACRHVHTFAPACNTGLPACFPCVCVCVCVCVSRVFVYVFQESQWLDSVSLLIKDTLEGEMLMIDNLSGSVFHHYSSPTLICKDCRGHPQEQIRMAEIEQASLKSEPLSDKSSSPALPDDLSLDEHTVFQLFVQESKGRCRTESHSSDEAGNGGAPTGTHQTQTLVQSSLHGFSQVCRARGDELESPVQEIEMQADVVHHSPAPDPCLPGGVSTGSNKESNKDEGGASGRSPLLHLPAEFFHPAGAAIPAPPRSRSLRLTRGLRLTSPASWASLRSPGARSKKLCTQYPSHSDSSLATGSSEGSLQTTLEEGLSFSISPPQNIPSAPLVCPHPPPADSTIIPSPVQTLRPRPNPSSALTLQATKGHQRSQSSGRGSTSPGYTRDDSIDPSDEDLGIVIGSSIGGCGSSQAGNSEHLSEALSSLSLTSLLLPSAQVYSGGAVKKCNSTGSLEQGGMLLSSRGRESRREILGMDPQGFLANPWTGVLFEKGRDDKGDGEQGLKARSSSQATLGPCRENR
ncbi:voltage-dependent T-type calcium channel subunit alpha-1I isoform X1 [Synchiropus splendidus]|uniref:voltage-dependent T-type calcium channel subunit alpha-1I isoform X1 n=1 Tax=Synchiropus splendidus TaxID=270530 RepID=UPI00237E822D|nr:voltage-dependent T-type calcium channel subunit alpha-1I isoform X1 [Synchiropus splendidus]